MLNTEDKKLLSDFQQAFFNDGYNMAKVFLKDGLSLDSLMELTKTLYNYMDEVTSLFIDHCNRQERRVDCRKGCSICCHQCIMLLPHEAFYLHQYINTQLSQRGLNEIIAQALCKAELTKNMEVEQYVHFKHPCPLLVNDACIAYEARPIACRIYLSSKFESCNDEYLDPKNFSVFPALYDFPLRTGRMINEGIYQALLHKSYSMAELKLENAIVMMFENNNLTNDWLDKKPIFEQFKHNELESKYLEKLSRPSPN